MSLDATGRTSRLLGRLFRQRPWPAGYAPRRILVVKTCCLGDALMATPTLTALRQAFPSAHIALMVGSWSRAVVENNPAIDSIVDCGTLGNGGSYSPGECLRLVGQIRRGGFDCCFVLERSPLLTALPWLAGIPLRVGLDSAGRGFSLTVRVPCPERRHEAELYLDTALAIGVQPREPRLRFYPTETNRSKAAAVAASLGEGIVAMHPAGGVNPGMNLVTKRWPAEKYGALADRLAEAGQRVALVGAPADQVVSDAVKASARAELTDLVGQLTLGELGALFERCRLVVANDTGPMHLAVAVGAPVVAIFGPSDPRVYGPYGQSDAVASCELPCSPCFKGGQAPHCDDPRCMNNLSVDDVWRLVDLRLRKRPPRH